MSKMVAPKMDVVRFRESDVIVASGVLRFTNFSDTVRANGQVSYNGHTYDTSNYPTRVDAFINALGNKAYIVPTTTGISEGVDNLLSYEYNREESVTADGDYYWDGSVWRYKAQ